MQRVVKKSIHPGVLVALFALLYFLIRSMV